MRGEFSQVAVQAAAQWVEPPPAMLPSHIRAAGAVPAALLIQLPNEPGSLTHTADQDRVPGSQFWPM